MNQVVRLRLGDKETDRKWNWKIGRAIQKLLLCTRSCMRWVSRTSRHDRIVIIMWEFIGKIWDKTYHNFEKRPFTNPLGSIYDYKSVMHYSSRAFSKNENRTITRIDGITTEFGNENGLSEEDAKQVNSLYKCNAQWGSWEKGSCDVNCGSGHRTDTRRCIVERLGYGNSCVGESRRRESCQKSPCRSCFPPHAFVRNEKGSKIEMKDLKVGEKVLTMDSSGRIVYSKISMMLHKDINQMVTTSSRWLHTTE